MQCTGAFVCHARNCLHLLTLCWVPRPGAVRESERIREIQIRKMRVSATRHGAHPLHGTDAGGLARARVAVRGEVQRHGKQPRVRGTREQRARTVIDETQLGLSREQARCGQLA
eukprot:scaffold66730_cov78-Phaeocystis_antarctica.AAC.1